MRPHPGGESRPLKMQTICNLRVFQTTGQSHPGESPIVPGFTVNTTNGTADAARIQTAFKNKKIRVENSDNIIIDRFDSPEIGQFGCLLDLVWIVKFPIVCVADPQLRTNQSGFTIVEQIVKR